MKYILMAFVFAVSLSALAQSTGAAGGGAPTTGEQASTEDVDKDCEGAVSDVSGTPVKVGTPVGTGTGGATSTPVQAQ